jgi:hypothetical protein
MIQLLRDGGLPPTSSTASVKSGTTHFEQIESA